MLRIAWILVATTAFTMTCGTTVAQEKDAFSFEKAVLPIFQAKCLNCHGDKKQRAMLDLRTKTAIVKGGESGSALKPGSLKGSLLWDKIRTDEMPEGEQKLTPTEKETVRRWIEAGAPGDDKAVAAGGNIDLQITDDERKFWAFQTPVRPQMPAVKADNPIDAFVLAALQKHKLGLSPEANRLTLLRRVTFDLTGLPPTLTEIEAFLGDASCVAYEKVVDRLLASPHYGERWARHWLDLAGYADSEGILDADYVRSAAWRYRDYVIRACNSDKPYDRFLQEQIAGDELVDYWRVHQSAKELPAEVVDALIATGYLRCASDTSRPDFASIKNAPGYYFQTLDDTVKIVASSTMGLTVQCAKCHSHKYDPIPQTDYYRMQAIFMSGYRPGQWVPQVQRQLRESTAVQEQEAKELAAKIDAVIAPLKKQQAELQAAFAAKLVEEGLAKLPAQIRDDVKTALGLDPAKRTEVQKYLAAKFETDLKPSGPVLAKKLDADAAYKAKQQKIADEIKSHESKKRTFAEIRAFYDLPGEAKTHLLKRGDYLQPGPEVAPGVLRVLASHKTFELPARPKDAKTSGRRLAFAQWLTSPEHPLTARVLVNRLWLHHFGQGLVATPDNFGKTGAPPSHPELLDWLACEFVGSVGDAASVATGAKATLAASPTKAWSIKRMHRLIVTSATYKQISAYRPTAHANAKQVDPDNRLLWRQRLRRLEGEAMRDAVLAVSGALNPQPFGPPVPMVRSGDGEINTPPGTEGNRRSIYLQVRRSQPLTFLQLFDQPVIETNCTRREVSTVASQALTLLNSDFMTRQAAAFADRVLQEQPTDLAARALLVAFGRPATDREKAVFGQFLDQQTQQHAKTQPAPEARRWAVADLCHMLLSANEFAYVD
jgi:phage gp36-like protein